MNIHSTIKSLYSIMCEAQSMCENPNKNTDSLKMLLRLVSDEDINEAMNNINYILSELEAVNGKLKGMYITEFSTGIDETKKQVIIGSKAMFGSHPITFNTSFSEEAARILVNGLNMALAFIDAGDKLSLHEGNA